MLSVASEELGAAAEGEGPHAAAVEFLRLRLLDLVALLIIWEEGFIAVLGSGAILDDEIVCFISLESCHCFLKRNCDICTIIILQITFGVAVKRMQTFFSILKCHIRV